MKTTALFNWLFNRYGRVEPDYTIGTLANPYLRRWFIIRRKPLVGAYLHQFMRSDDDRALHDHPYRINVSIVLSGCYVEHTIDRGGINRRTVRKAGDVIVRLGPSPHRVEIEQPCWTLFLWASYINDARGAHWGFHCQNFGWVHWLDFTNPEDGGATVGRGCGEVE